MAHHGTAVEPTAVTGYDTGMRFLFAIAAGTVALLSSATLAQDRQQPTSLKVDIEGRTISVPAPFGYCDLEPTEARDQLLIAGLDRLTRQDRVLRRLAPCDELKSWREDSTHDPIEVVQILWPGRLGPAGDDRRAFLRRAVPGDVLGKARVLELAEEGFPAAAEENKFAAIGLIERNDRAAILAEAVVARIDGKSHQLIALSATTAIGPTAVITQVLTPYDDGSELDWMLRDTREHVDRLLSAAGETSRRFRESRPPISDTPPGDVTTRKARAPRDRSTPGFFDNNGGYIALGLVVGGALLIAIGMLVARRLRPAP